MSKGDVTMGLRTSLLGCLTLAVTATLGCSRSSDTPQTAGAAAGGQTQSQTPVDTCAILSQDQIAGAVGNAVLAGQAAGAGSCSWSTEKRGDVTVLLIVHQKGSIREPILCEDVRKRGGSERVEGLDVATWKVSSTLGLFNSGEFEACGPKGFLSLQLNAERDEATLKKATLALVQLVLRRI
jgi:hypothetical protein